MAEFQVTYALVRLLNAPAPELRAAVRKLEEMRDHAADAGRTDVRWHNCMNVWCGIGADRDEARGYVARAMQAFYQAPYENFEKWSGTPAEVADFLAPYLDAGCHTLNLQACGAGLEAEIDGVAEIRARLGA